jgi:hypothetical protein
MVLGGIALVLVTAFVLERLLRRAWRKSANDPDD